MTLAKKLKKGIINGLAALVIGCSGLNCDSNTSNQPTVECKSNSDCKTGYQCLANKCVNQAPIANAGAGQPLNFDANCFASALYNNNGLCPSGYSIKNNIHPGNKVTLNGSLSSDPEGQPLQYLWRQISGPSATLSSNSIVNPYFTPSIRGDYSFGLQVSDGVKTSTEVTTTTYVRNDLAPVANAGLNSYGNIAGITTVNLDGSASYDKDGIIVKCEWDYTGGGTYDWSSTSTCSTTHIYPSPGNFNATLRVTDDDGTQSTNTKFVEVN